MRLGISLLLTVLLGLAGAAPAAGIEDYASYDAPRSCHPKPRPGTDYLGRWVARQYGGGYVGFGRACSKRDVPTSEHQTGRAFDWSLDASRKRDRRTAREFLQRLGGTARDVLGVNVWVDAAVRCMDPNAPVVFTDARFLSEADEIRSRGGLVLRVNRPGVGPAVAADGTIHKSETALDKYDFDHVVVNDGTVQDLHRTIAAIVGLRWPRLAQG